MLLEGLASSDVCHDALRMQARRPIFLIILVSVCGQATKSKHRPAA